MKRIPPIDIPGAGIVNLPPEEVERAEALAHVGDYRVTDIYAARNWDLSWEANRKVLDLFRWPDNPGQE